MKGIDDIGSLVNAAYENVSPDQLGGAGPALEAATATVGEILGGSEAGEQIVGHLTEAQRRLANALVYLGDARSNLGAYLTAIGFGEPAPPVETTNLRLQAILDHRAKYDAHQARLEVYRATFVEGVREISETVDTEILPEWPVAREALIEQLAVSPLAKVEVRHWHADNTYIVTARWEFREGDFDDVKAPTTQIVAQSTISEKDIGPLMDALQYLKKPQQYRLPKKRGPYDVPVVWDNATGRFSYPAVALWSGVARQLATSAHHIDASGEQPGVSGTVIENTSDLPTIADNLRSLANGHNVFDPTLPVISEIMKADTNDAAGAVRYLRQRYITGKRIEINRSRKVTDLIATALPVPGSRGIEIIEIKY